jgi:hypothetical protein
MRHPIRLSPSSPPPYKEMGGGDDDANVWIMGRRGTHFVCVPSSPPTLSRISTGRGGARNPIGSNSFSDLLHLHQESGGDDGGVS